MGSGLVPLGMLWCPIGIQGTSKGGVGRALQMKAARALVTRVVLKNCMVE